MSWHYWIRGFTPKDFFGLRLLFTEKRRLDVIRVATRLSSNAEPTGELGLFVSHVSERDLREVRIMQFKRQQFILLIGLAVCVLLLALGWRWYRSGSGVTSEWSSKSGTSVPPKFTYLLFPKEGGVMLVTSAGASSSIELNRAFACSEDELRSGRPLGVWVGEDEFYIARDRVTFNPGGPDRKKWLDEWRNVIRAEETPGSSGKPKTDVEIHPIGEDAYSVKLTFVSPGGYREVSTYRVSGDAVMPESFFDDTWRRLAR